MDELEKSQELLKLKDEEITILKAKIQKMEACQRVYTSADKDDLLLRETCSSLTNKEVLRYSRQLILPELGVKGQLKLKNSSVLIVGAGGLGCPAAVYLAAAGIGRLGVVDYDEVDLSNLHRQILHTEDRVGGCKAESVAQGCNRLNSDVDYVPYHLQLDSNNALDIIRRYDIVLDATDNVATRYLLNDACVMADKPLVSGSALRMEGQLTVYHYDGGPCYRCLYPVPPPPETVTNCSDGGVIGVVPGVIGSMQALEAIKIASGMGSSYKARLLMFDAMDGSFRTPRLRGRNLKCHVCGDEPSITQLVDYVQFCGASPDDKDKESKLLSPGSRITAKTYSSMLERAIPHVLVDVRAPGEMEICALPYPALNIPLASLQRSDPNLDTLIQELTSRINISEESVLCVCRQGNDSQKAVLILQKLLPHKDVTDIVGGLKAWHAHIDPDFPIY